MIYINILQHIFISVLKGLIVILYKENEFLNRKPSHVLPYILSLVKTT